jgi:hypothetical protein
MSRACALALRLLCAVVWKEPPMKSIRLIAIVTFVLSCLALAHARCAAAASDGPGAGDAPSVAFGAPGSLVIAASAISAYHQSSPAIDQRGGSAQLAAHLFVGHGVSAGVAFSESWSRIAENGMSLGFRQYALGARLGGLLPFSPWASTWPQLGIGFLRAPPGSIGGIVPLGPAGAPAETTLLELDLDLPVLLHPTRWFFIGAGPVVQARIGDGGESVSVAGHLTFGGAFDAVGG